jgi:hypothetical protein
VGHWHAFNARMRLQPSERARLRLGLGTPRGRELFVPLGLFQDLELEPFVVRCFSVIVTAYDSDSMDPDCDANRLGGSAAPRTAVGPGAVHIDQPDPVLCCDSLI